MSDWVYDPDASCKDARTEPRKASAPPHWLRCDYVKDGQRCTKGSGHSGDHAAGKTV